jgi:hypothetical protein
LRAVLHKKSTFAYKLHPNSDKLGLRTPWRWRNAWLTIYFVLYIKIILNK